MSGNRNGTALVAVREKEHRAAKAVAARHGLRLGALVSDVLAAWLAGRVYVCPEGSVECTRRALDGGETEG